MDKEEKKQYDKSLYDMYKSHNFCVKCHKQDTYTLNGHAYCFECAETMKKNNITPEARERYNKTKSQLRASREENHLCKCCGKLLEPNYPFKNCPVCKAKMRKYAERARQKKGITPRWLFDGVVMCKICGKQEISEGTPLCNACLNNCRKKLVKAREILKGKDTYFTLLNNAFWKERRR